MGGPGGAGSGGMNAMAQQIFAAMSGRGSGPPGSSYGGGGGNNNMPGPPGGRGGPGPGGRGGPPGPPGSTLCSLSSRPLCCISCSLPHFFVCASLDDDSSVSLVQSV